MFMWAADRYGYVGGRLILLMGVRVGVALWALEWAWLWALKWACKLYDFLKFLGGLWALEWAWQTYFWVNR